MTETTRETEKVTEREEAPATPVSVPERENVPVPEPAIERTTERTTEREAPAENK